MAKSVFPKRRDAKHRVLRVGESVREDGLYQFKYHVNGKPKFIYSWRLEPTDKLPQGKKPCLSLREMEKKIGYDLDSQMDPSMKNLTVMELVRRYLATRTGAKPSTLTNYKSVTWRYWNMNFADEMKDLASSVPKPGKEYWDNHALKKIYENVKAEIRLRAHEGKLSGTIMCCFWEASPVQREFETELVFSKYNLDGYVMGSKFCIKIISKKGFLQIQCYLSAPQEGKWCVIISLEKLEKTV